jgi:methyltransferase (TIGR00027 family)
MRAIMKRRIETKTSRTAEMTCLSRAASYWETDSHYKSDDYIAPLLLPAHIKPLLRVSLARNIFLRMIAPKGIYEYVIARTKYIDTVYEKALTEQFDQILIFGAGFDTRALRFQGKGQNTKVFELDVPVTQRAKIGQYHKRHLAVPSNVTFIAIDFDKEVLPEKLDEAGFQTQQRSLFVLEGLLMYLQPESVHATFQTMMNYAGKDSWVVFDYIHESVLRKEGNHYGESQIAETVTSVGEQWCFGIERGGIEQFLREYEFELINHKDGKELEKEYFIDKDGNIVGKVNDTHCLVTAGKL